MSDKNIIVGKYDTKFNDILGLNYKEYDIVRSKGLLTHLIKRKHYIAAKYIDYVSDIILNPDYIGFNNKEENKSIELVKRLAHNVFISVKLDKSKNQLYVATMITLTDSKLESYIKSGRLKEVVDK